MIAVTAASQPSIEDLVLGAFPWIPKVNFNNPFLVYENGDEFVRYFRDAAEGKVSPFILVVEGSTPNEKNKEERYWATFGTDPKSGQPIPINAVPIQVKQAQLDTWVDIKTLIVEAGIPL
jgi:hydrogenase small subunit